MRIGVVKEIKTKEARVGITPDGTRALVADGHEVLVEQGAGIGAGFGDHLYEQAGAKLVSQEDAWDGSELLVKVKEPIAAEYRFLREDLTVFIYLHLAADRPLTEPSWPRTLSIAYETVQDYPPAALAGRQ